MNRVYCISDLHGHYQIFLEMLKKISFGDQDEMYVLGDCNDRGVFAYEIYDYIFKHDKNIHLIKGNHEVMMRDTMLVDDWKKPDARLWSQNGGKRTMEQLKAHFKVNDEYTQESECEFKKYCKKLIEYINGCPNYVELNVNGKDYVLIHAGINPEKGLYEQDETECIWMREWFYLSKGLDNKTIIFGHTPTVLIDGRTKHGLWYDEVYKDKIGIDGGLANFKEGQLNCLCLNDMSLTSIRLQDVREES